MLVINRFVLFTVIVLILSCLIKCDYESSRIKSLHILSQIQSRFAITVIKSEIINLAPSSEEIFFTAQLPEEAFISNFSMVIDNKIIYGDVKERKMARKVYDEAVRAGQSAGHVSEIPREMNAFDISVNVAGGQSVIFNLTYQELLKRTNGAYKHVINIQPQQRVDKLLVDILINEQAEITTLKVPKFGDRIGEKSNNLLLDYTGSTNYKQENCAVTAASTPSSSYAYIRCIPKRNFDDTVSGQLVVLYDVKNNLNGGHIQVMNGYFIHFFAPDGCPRVRKNVLFVLDKSGSMEGRKFQQLQIAMRTILRDLDGNDGFNFVTFNHVVDFWRHYSVQANEENIREGIRYIDRMYVSGATNIYDALKSALEILGRDQLDSLASMIIFLTDGEATVGEINRDDIVNKITALNNKRFIIHSLAFGNAADFNLVRRISSSNRGLARRIYENLDANLQLAGFYREISSPLLTNVQIKYYDQTVDVSSLVRRDDSYIYYGGSEIVVVGKLKGYSRHTSQFMSEVTATSQSGPMVYRAESSFISCPNNYALAPGGVLVQCCINFYCRSPSTGQRPPVREPLLPASSLGGFIERVWAYQTIKKYLKDAEFEPNHSRKQLRKQQALQLSLQYKFVTELTSMVVVKPAERNAVQLEEVNLRSKPARENAQTTTQPSDPVHHCCHSDYDGERGVAGGYGGERDGMTAVTDLYYMRLPDYQLKPHPTFPTRLPLQQVYIESRTAANFEEGTSVQRQIGQPPEVLEVRQCQYKVVFYLDLSSTRLCMKNFNYFVNFQRSIQTRSIIRLKLKTVTGNIDVRPTSDHDRTPTLQVVQMARDACTNPNNVAALRQEMSFHFPIDKTFKNAVFLVGNEAPDQSTIDLIEYMRRSAEIAIVNLGTSGDASWRNLVPEDHYFLSNHPNGLIQELQCSSFI